MPIRPTAIRPSVPDLIRLSSVAARPFGLRLSRLACWALVVTATGGTARAQETLQLRLQNDLLAPTKKTRVGALSFARADRIEGTTDTDLTLTGDGELRRAGGDVFTADSMHYVQVDDELFAHGAVRIVRDGNVYTGPELRLKLDDYSGYFVKPEYALTGTRNRTTVAETQILTASTDPLYAYRNPVASNRSGFPGHGNADRADFIDRDHVELYNPLYTTCRADGVPDTSDWFIKAETMSLDQTTQIGVARNARIVFKGVPILASPYISFPLDDSRKSGFLPPTLSVTSRNGLEFLQPYYYNLAPNYDLTLYPKVISARGLQLGAEARYLSPTFNGDLRGEGLARDKLDNDKSRYALSTLNNFNSAPWSGYANLNKVSDDNYFVDYSRTIALSSQRILPRDAAVTYSQPYWYATIHELRYQTLQDPVTPITPPYEKSPEILFHGARLDVLGGFDFNVDVNATRFIHPTLASGDRYIFNPSVAFPILRPGWFVTPKLSYSATHYSVADQPSGVQHEFNRSLPTGSVDSGLVFERDTSLFGRDLRQTLEPRLFYVRTPYRFQDNLPNYDSGITDFNFAQLFSENQYGGSDRIVDANQLTAAVSTRFINNTDGAEIFRASLGQRYYFSQERVTLPGQLPVDGKRSDVLAEISGQISRDFSIDAGVQYSPVIRGVIRDNIGISYRPEPTKVINAEYRYTQGDLEQVDVSAQWPLFRNLYAVGRVNYSTRDRKAIETLAGFEYSGCCWVVRAVASRYVTGTATATSTLFLQLELNGLARLGSNPLESLKRNVPGYQLVNPPPPAGSPYRNYQ
ncbi:MAG: LPS-assembly protein LptD [Burkholderiaceae bacterium]